MHDGKSTISARPPPQHPLASPRPPARSVVCCWRRRWLRVGSSDEMVYHHMLDIFSIISRGGWDCKADSMLFHYLTVDGTISQAGKALANWHNPKMPVSAPTLNAIITPANKAQVEAFCCELFGTSSIPNTSTEMKEFRNVLVAVLR